MLTEVAVDKALTDSRQYTLSSNTQFSTAMELKTQEGDVVTLSFQNADTYEGTQEQDNYKDGSAVSAISSTATAASQYSMAVQGDLTDNELVAIQELSGKIAPIVEKFFSGVDLDLQESAQDLAKSLGTVQEINIALSKTVSQTVSVSSQSSADLQKAGKIDLPQSDAEVTQADYPKVRNLQALAAAVVTSEFKSQATQFKSSEPILRSLGDLLTFIRDQFGTVLKPLSAIGADFPETPESSKPRDPSPQKVASKETAPTDSTTESV
jgi:hypothetical protein